MARVLLRAASEDHQAMHRLAEALRRAGHEPTIVGFEDDDNFIHSNAKKLSSPGEVIERSDAVVIGHSRATRFDASSFVLWTAAKARKPAFVAGFDDTRPRHGLSGAYWFGLRRSSWNRDVEPLIAALGRSTSFVDREVELTELAQHLSAGTRVAVVGGRGMGKRTLVAEFVRRHATEYPASLHHILISRQGTFSIISATLDKVRRLLIIEIEDVAADVSSLVHKYQTETGAAHAIVIAEARPAEFPGAVLELPPLPHAQALQLFERRAGPTEEPAELQEREAIVTAIGGNPLALVSAADLHRRGWRLASSAAAMTRFITAGAPPDSPERMLLAGTFPFATEGVPIAWAALVGRAGPELEAAAAARRLEAAGLVHLGPDPDTFTVHPVVHEALRGMIALEAQRVMWERAEELVTGRLTQALMRQIDPHDPLFEHAEALASDRDDQDAGPWRGALLERMAERAIRLEYKYEALQLLERAERITARHRVVHGDLHAIVAARLASLEAERDLHDRARRLLAESIAAAQGQAEGSARWRDIDPGAYEQALAAGIAAAEKVDDPGNAARMAFLLADFHGRRGAWERAGQIAEPALRAARRAEDPMLIARAYRLLADVALHGSRYEDARASYEEAIRRLDQLGVEELAATSRLLYVNLLLQLNRREAAVRHAEWLRGYLERAPADWPYHAEAVETLRLFDESATGGQR